MTTAAAALEVDLLVRGRPTRTWRSDDGVITIGSDPGMTIRAARGTLHPHHATLHVEDGQVIAVAEGDAPVLHNGEPVSVAVIGPSDQLRVGPLTLAVRVGTPSGARLYTGTPVVSPRAAPRRDAPPPDAPRVGVRLPDGRARQITLRSGRFVLGSTHGNLRIPGLVDRHAELVVDGPRVELLAMDGPVQLDGRLVAAVPLRQGARARLGEVEIWLDEPDDDDLDDDAEDADPPTVQLPSEALLREMQAVPQRAPPGPARAVATYLPEDPADDDEAIDPTAAPAPRREDPEPDPLDQTARPAVPRDLPEITESPEPTVSRMMVTGDPTSTLEALAPGDPTHAPASELTRSLGDPVAKHPDDEDYDEELDFVVPFDLVGELKAIPERDDLPGTRCVGSVLVFERGRVRDLGIVDNGETLEVPGGPRLEGHGRHVLVTWPEGTHDLRGVRPDRATGALELLRGQSTVGTRGNRTWRVTAVAATPSPIFPNLPRTVAYGILLGAAMTMSVGTHGLLGIGVNTLTIIDGTVVTEEIAQEEQFVEVEMRLEEPPEVRQQKATLELAEKAPEVTSQEVVRASRMPRSENTSVSSLLTRLEAAGSGGGGGLVDEISNIDAVAAGSGANTAFDLAGRLAAGSGVKVARKGTGAVNTAGQVGDGVGKLAAGARGGMRGKVTKLSSRMKVQGTLDPSEVTRVVNAHMGAIQACYEREMTKDPGLAGRIQFEWTIAQDGTVRGVRVQSSTMPSDVVANCISAEIKTWRFARPTGGDAVISYPFAFRSG